MIFDFLCFFAYISCSIGPRGFKLGQDVEKLPLIVAIGIDALKVKAFCCYIMFSECHFLLIHQNVLRTVFARCF